MSPAEAIAEARKCGLRLTAEGSSLVLEADREPPPEVVHAVSENKAAIVRLLNEQAGPERRLEALAEDTQRRAKAATRAALRDPEELAFAEAERDALQNEPELAPEVTRIRAPRFRSPRAWWDESREARCTRCGRVSHWRPDQPPEGRTIVGWRCTRCYPAESKEQSA